MLLMVRVLSVMGMGAMVALRKQTIFEGLTALRPLPHFYLALRFSLLEGFLGLGKLTYKIN